MVRLLQGDVGCGKTVVAAAAAARAAGSGLQAALMAPTELLAEQHWRNFRDWFHPLHLPVALVSGSQPARARRSALEAIASARCGSSSARTRCSRKASTSRSSRSSSWTSSIASACSSGCDCRKRGASEGRFPHQLIMTATPIPRTLAMTAYADLDISVIDEMPPGRTPVQTVVVPEQRRE